MKVLQSQNIHIKHKHTKTNKYKTIYKNKILKKIAGELPEKVNRAKHCSICSQAINTYFRFCTFSSNFI